MRGEQEEVWFMQLTQGKQRPRGQGLTAQVGAADLSGWGQGWWSKGVVWTGFLP